MKKDTNLIIMEKIRETKEEDKMQQIQKKQTNEPKEEQKTKTNHQTPKHTATKIIFFFLVIFFIAILIVSLYWLSQKVPITTILTKSYTAQDFGIETIHSSHDENQNGIDDYTDILLRC